MLEKISSFCQNTDISTTLGEKAKTKTNANLNKLNSAIAKNSDLKDAKKIVLASKGEAGYCPQFDMDNDGIITLDEFNQYCSDNEIDEKDKLRLLSIMQHAKMSQKLQEEEKKAKEETPENEKGKSIYARRGEKKYDERMDENKDAIITYEEYEKYCEKIANKETKANANDFNSASSEEKKIQEAYSIEADEPIISVEAEA